MIGLMVSSPTLYNDIHPCQCEHCREKERQIDRAEKRQKKKRPVASYFVALRETYLTPLYVRVITPLSIALGPVSCLKTNCRQPV